MLLTAVDEGLGACFFGIQPENIAPLRAEFEIPDDYAPIGAITVGHRAPDAPAQPVAVDERRKGTHDVVHRGAWGVHA